MSNRRAAGWAMGLAAILFIADAATAQEVRTIAPGMTADDVTAAFGQPDGVSSRGPFTYYFYNNGCEYECGFPDLVILQDGQVVDAVLRAPWNEYSGASSSPKGTVARPTPGGMRLEVPTTIESVEVRPAQTPPAETPPAETPPVETPPVETPPVEAPPAETPPAVAPADEPVEVISQEFFAFVPVCAEAMVASGLTEGDAQTLCQCTAMESSALGVEPSTMAEFTERVRQDPTYQTEDERIRQASSICFERLTGGAEPDTP